MKIALLKYSNTTNIGDNIQTLAVAQHLDQEYGLVDRDFLNEYDGDPVVVVMQGWFTHEPQNWPPSPKITPVFFGFHMTPDTAKALERHKDYFSKFAPIGCRDQATAAIFREWGIDAYVSGCATMTFPKRTKAPELPRTILVNQTRRHFPRSERNDYVEISQEFPIYLADTAAKFQIAKELLAYYRDHAGLVVTSRIHCAMPCAAMGIPVVFTGVREGRTEVIDIVGIPYARTKRFPRTRLVDLPVTVSNLDAVKGRITSDLHARLTAHGVRVKNPG